MENIENIDLDICECGNLMCGCRIMLEMTNNELEDNLIEIKL